MSGIFSDILSIFASIFKAIFNFIKKYLVIIIMVIIIVLICIYAPEIIGFLAESGAPAWMGSAVAGLAGIGDVVLLDAEALLGVVGGWLGSIWSAIELGGIGAEAAAVIGIGLIIDPSGTTQLLSDIGSTVGGLIGSVVGSTVSGLLGSSGGIIIVLLGAAYLLTRSKSKSDTVDVSTTPAGGAPTGA